MPLDCSKCLESIKLHLPEDLKRDLQDLAMQDEQWHTTHQPKTSVSPRRIKAAIDALRT